MTEPERVALDHIRRVVDSVIGEIASPEIIPIPQAAANILPVPYITNYGTESADALPDPGASVGAMLMRAYTDKFVTLADFCKQSGQQGNTPLSLTQVSNTLRLNGVPVELRSGLKLSDLSLIIFSGRPAILLVDHATLKQAGWTPMEYSGQHFLVGVGLDVKQIYVHDPLRLDMSGKTQGIPWLLFYQAWTKAAGFERAVLVPRQQLVRRVKVAAATLSVRSNPADETVVGTVSGEEVFEITAQLDGWGKIGENRWISLSYVTDI